MNLWNMCIEGLRKKVPLLRRSGGALMKKSSDQAHVPPVGPKNEILLARMGINMWVRSWVPIMR